MGPAFSVSSISEAGLRGPRQQVDVPRRGLADGLGPSVPRSPISPAVNGFGPPAPGHTPARRDPSPATIRRPRRSVARSVARRRRMPSLTDFEIRQLTDVLH
jgi:hypothetical protein